MTTEALTYWLAGTIPATATWTLNFIFRGGQALRSSAADWALMLLAFDGAIAIGARDLACYVPNAEIRELIPALAPALIFLSLVTWTVIVRWIEPAFTGLSQSGRSHGIRIGTFMTMWIFVGFNLFFHYCLFGRGFNVD